MRCSSFQSLIQCFFTDRWQKQLGASPYTVAAYRDAFGLLLRFASERLGRAPSELRVEDLDAAFLGKFLENLERTRGNCARTRNNRLAALHAILLNDDADRLIHKRCRTYDQVATNEEIVLS